MITGDNLADEFKQLEAGPGADAALDELKAKMGLSAPEEPAAALPAAGQTGGTELDDIEAELAALKAKAEVPAGSGGGGGGEGTPTG